MGIDWALVGGALLGALPVILGAVAVLVALFLLRKWASSDKDEDKERKRILGYAIMAVRGAEKVIKDDGENKWLQKADEALKLFCSSYEKYEGKEPSDAAKALFVTVKEEVLLKLKELKEDSKPVEPVEPVE